MLLRILVLTIAGLIGFARILDRLPVQVIDDDRALARNAARFVLGAVLILAAVCAIAPWFCVDGHDENLPFAGSMLVWTLCVSSLLGTCFALVATVDPDGAWKGLALACLALGIATLLDMVSVVDGFVGVGWIASLVLHVIVVVTTIAIPTRSIPLARIA